MEVESLPMSMHIICLGIVCTKVTALHLWAVLRTPSKKKCTLISFKFFALFHLGMFLNCLLKNCILTKEGSMPYGFVVGGFLSHI